MHQKTMKMGCRCGNIATSQEKQTTCFEVFPKYFPFLGKLWGSPGQDRSRSFQRGGKAHETEMNQRAWMTPQGNEPSQFHQDEG